MPLLDYIPQVLNIDLLTNSIELTQEIALINIFSTSDISDNARSY
jgi:hypothetical protein